MLDVSSNDDLWNDKRTCDIVAPMFVYVIGQHKVPGLLKIGISGNPPSRLASLQSGSPVPLAILHFQETPRAAAVERRVHKSLRKHRRHGEWFDVGLIVAVREIAKAMGNLAGQRGHQNDWSHYRAMRKIEVNRDSRNEYRVPSFNDQPEQGG